MNLLTMELNRRYGDKGLDSASRPILAVSVNPGAVKSDIWRHVPTQVKWVYDRFMDVFYLTTEQGCATSLYAAICESSRLTSCSASTVEGGKLRSHPSLPYLVPYASPCRLLAFEMLGFFAGPQTGRPSLPPTPTKTAAELWEFSDQICDKTLGNVS